MLGISIGYELLRALLSPPTCNLSESFSREYTVLGAAGLLSGNRNQLHAVTDTHDRLSVPSAALCSRGVCRQQHAYWVDSSSAIASTGTPERPGHVILGSTLLPSLFYIRYCLCCARTGLLLLYT